MFIKLQVSKAVDRINDLSRGELNNVRAMEGYKNNCAATIGQWNILYCCFETRSTRRPSSVVSTHDTDGNQDNYVKSDMGIVPSEVSDNYVYRASLAESPQQRVDPRLTTTTWSGGMHVHPLEFPSWDITNCSPSGLSAVSP
jgi:hypothetical protein